MTTTLTAVRLPAGGSLLRWLKAAGDAVRAGDLIAEVETDKSVVEIEAGVDGWLTRQLAEPGGDALEPGAVIAEISDAAPAAASTPAPANAAGAIAPQAVSAPPAPAGPSRLRISPYARRLAVESRVPLASLAGSGPEGRIVARDVRAWIEALAAGQARPGVPGADRPAADGAAGARRIPLTSMRATIARRLTESVATIPQFQLSGDFEIDALLALRADVNEGLQSLAVPPDDAPLRLSLNDFLVKAIARVLERWPQANCTWDGDALLQHDRVDIGIAVALEAGLVTPVLRDAGSRTLSSIAAESAQLVRRAREGRLTRDDMSGGATTISNLGMFGVQRFNAIINPPQATIFAVGAARQAVVVRDDAPAVAQVITVTLTCDHRVIDGALGARMLQTLRQLVEKPSGLLL